MAQVSLGTGRDQTEQFLDIELNLKHAPHMINESVCNANTKAVSTPREKLQEKFVFDGRNSPILKKHDADLQYFMTEDTEEFSHFTDSVACREYTLPRDDKSSDPKDWIRGNTKIGPVLEVTTSYLQGKYGVEIRIESINKDHSHSWVRITHGLNKWVTNLNNKEHDDNEQETSEMQFEDFLLRIECTCFCKPIKG